MNEAIVQGDVLINYLHVCPVMFVQTSLSAILSHLLCYVSIQFKTVTTYYSLLT